MKKTVFFLIIFITIFMLGSFVSAQPVTAGFRGQSMNGSTGLYSIPTGRIGWEGNNSFGFDFGYRAIINDDRGTAHIPAITLSFSRWIELSAAFDFQPKRYAHIEENENNDLIFGAKLKLPTNANSPNNLAIAIGGNF